MSKFYGTLQAGERERTMRGFIGIKTTAQSWHGSIGVRLWYDNETENLETLNIELAYGVGSTNSPAEILYTGKFINLLRFFWFNEEEAEEFENMGVEISEEYVAKLEIRNNALRKFKRVS